MGEVVNLRLARKAKRRTKKQTTASANRLLFGRKKAEKAAAKAENARLNRDLDGARRD